MQLTRHARILILLLLPTMSDNSAFAAEEAALRPRLQKRIYRSADGQTLPYRLHIPNNYDPAREYPLILFLHGAGERGVDNEAQLLHPEVLRFINDDAAARHPCFLVAPQCPEGHRWVETPWDSPRAHATPVEPSLPTRLTMEILDSLEKEFRIDPDRRYATGMSMGGFGVFDLLVRRPGHYAAAIVICGGADNSKAKEIAAVAYRVFHGADDGAVPVARSRSIVEALKQAGARVHYTEYEGAGHNVWSRAYQEPELVDWLFARKRGA
ncbi:MAG: phospholipase [Rhodopirellula sp.]|nr:phospholipase [Rhodopirellula sp.]